jgi:murein DD-endopeptidase MepM/ murein hydrolase activator NlpD
MLRTHVSPVLALAACVLLGSAGTAHAHTTSGGTSAPERPQIEAVQCDATDATRCAEGDVLRVDGEFLDSTESVVFLGARGRGDNRKARPSDASPHEVVVRVPAAAESGPVRVKSRLAGVSPKSPAIEVDATPAGVPADAAFPVDGTYDFGTAVNGFGGGRNHKGQDILAKCGTPVLAAQAGRVSWVRSEGAAGNYAVISAADGASHVYMHLLKPATIAEGARVTAGQQIGQVGQTGRASACHLHFELWTAPGWYRGGEPVDPLPTLESWVNAG